MLTINTRMHLFAYGLLKSRYDNEAALTLRASARLIGKGHFPGLLFDLGSYPAAISDPDASSFVYGEVFEVPGEEDELIRFLDHFEGVGPAFPEPQEYRRDWVPVTIGKEIIPCQTYLYNRDWKSLSVITSGNYEG